MTEAPADTEPRAGWWRSTTGGLPRPFWFIWFGTLVNRFGYFVIPFLSLYLVRGRGLSAETAGLILTAFGAGSLLSQPIGGWLADVVGRRFTLTAGMVGTAVAYLALGAASSPVALAACAVAAGLTLDIYRPAVGALVADLVPPERRARAYGLLYWAVNLGVAIASIAGGVLAQRGYWLLFVLDAATCLIFAVIVFRAVPETRPGRTPGEGGGFGSALRDPALLLLTGSTFVMAVVYFQHFVTLPLVMTGEGLRPSAYGLVIAVNAILIICVQPLAVRRLAQLAAPTAYAVSGVISGIGFGLTALAGSLPAYAGTVVVWTIGEIVFQVAGPVLVAALAPEALRGRYQGVWGTAWGLAMFAAPLTGTWTLQHLGSAALWVGCLVASSAAGITGLALHPMLRTR